MDLIYLLGALVGAVVILAAILSKVPASRAMRADLVARAMPGVKAVQYARSLAARDHLSVLDYIGATSNQIPSLLKRDREDELLGSK